MNAPAVQDQDIALRRVGDGVELSVVLGPAHAPDTVRAALELGLSSALCFDAGLACSADGRLLVLARWLDAMPDAAAMATARAALLEQRAAWRALLPSHDGADRAVSAAARAGHELRQQQRLRSLFSRTTP